MPRFRALQGKYASRLSGILQVAYDRKPIAVNLQITGFKAYNRVRLSYTRLHHKRIRRTPLGVRLFVAAC